MTDLDKARSIIDETDREMAALFVRRMNAVKLVAEYKKNNGLPITNAAREEEVIEKNSARIEDAVYRSYYASFIRHTMALSKDLQRRLLQGMRVAFSGVTGAFAEIAARRIFPTADLIPYPDFSSAYKAVETGAAECVLLPLENSFNGDVGQVMDLSFFGSLHINGVYEAEIVQNLLANRGADVRSIRTVISHPQALGQCAPYIEKHGFLTEDAVNTAVAAKKVAESGRTDIAAIGSREAAEELGLCILDAHINQSSTNTTRFAVFSASRRQPEKDDKRFILLFTVKNVAGALGRAVSIIGEHGFNLRALKSRPTKDLIWSYYFYAEGEGAIESPEGEKMLARLRGCCDNLRVIGSYERDVRI